ncbi:SDR family oxidoreductase [Microvirga pudoricolor]|uniref:SDR family oxidoreductase n=1 Tax=Microvirga pudoricolor TaxID=2778729 RepID=UPI0019521220|nr:SDR family oxidoreductase [Microvirga pudoricolor]MBM6595034.1 SDR family oxidoreductase [Microvirga pudoricolor]
MKLFVFGLGYTSQAFIARYRDRFTTIAGTVRAAEKAARLSGKGIHVHALENADKAALLRDFREADVLLVSAGPSPDGDPCLARFGGELAKSRMHWIGYLSTIGVYGDHGGGWVDETTPIAPATKRAKERIAAEKAWLAAGRETGKAVQIFRLAGIYGPGRNALVNLAQGKARRIVKPGQVFSRIHVDDIAAVLMASIEHPRPGAVYNVADNESGPPQDVIAYAAELAGIEPPPEIPFEKADMTPMAREFYADNKRVSNRLIREELGVKLIFPTYREGLKALLAEGEGGYAA